MEKDKIKISVVIPVYNVKNYLNKALNSVINQTLKEIEIICVNDGSTDGSTDILYDFSQKDDRIKIINKKNTGYGDSMNVGINNAEGEYVAIVEPDDYIDSEMFKTLYSVAKENDADVVKSNFYEFSEGKKQKYIRGDNTGRLYNKILNKTNKKIFFFRMNTWTGIYRREFLTEKNIKHNTSPGASFQDNGFWFLTLALCNSVYFVDKAFYHYRLDNPSSSINDKTRIYTMFEEFAFIEKQLKERGLYNELEGVFLTKKYHNLIYRYFCIADEFKSDYLLRFGDEFKTVDLSVMKSFANKKQIASIKEIVADTETFLKKYKGKDLTAYHKETLPHMCPLIRSLIFIKKFGIKNFIKTVKKR